MLGMAPDYDSLTIVQKVGVTTRSCVWKLTASCQPNLSASDV